VQRELCADFAVGEGFQVVEEQFDDEGYSGASLDRPALQELLIQVRRGQIHAVAVQRLDRLSRRVSHCAGILDEFRRAGVEVLIAEIPESAKGASGRPLTNLLSSFAEFERDMTTCRIADTRAGLVARGRRIAGRIPFGYSTDPKTKQLVPAPREAGIVKTMFELVADGVKTSVVEETALLRNWRTRSGKLWTARQILDTVLNPVYIGRFRAPKGSRPGGHPPIIDEALFQRCADAIAVRRTGSAQRRRSHSGINWVVRGLLYCGSCGRKPCKGVMVNAYAIEAAVLAELDVGSRLSSKEQADAVKERAARILFDATSGKVRVELIKPPDGSARDEAEATGQHAETGRRKSGLRHR
jgi:DNA invertase Pin-like site-specific DNA recombinase